MLSNRTTGLIRSLGATAAIALRLVVGLTGCGSPAPSGPSSQPAPQTTEVNPAGDIPDNQAYVTFTSGTAAYSVKVPEGWARTTSGTATTFTDKLNSITVDETSVSSAPTVDSAQGAVVSALQTSTSKFQLGDVKTFTRPGGDGVVVTYLDDSAPNAVTGKVAREDVQLFLFWKNGTQVALTLSAPQGADNVDPWNIVTKSFSWLG